MHFEPQNIASQLITTFTKTDCFKENECFKNAGVNNSGCLLFADIDSFDIQIAYTATEEICLYK